jgi:hypothetical protein
MANTHRPTQDSRAIAKAVVAIVLIALAGTAIGFHVRSRYRNPGRLRERNVVAIDSKTLKVYTLVKQPMDTWPLTNPDTDQPTLWPAWHCMEEDIIFPGPPNVLITSCPNCRRGRVGGATMEQKDLPVRVPEGYPPGE